MESIYIQKTKKTPLIHLNLEENVGKFWQNGGSCIADPTGKFLIKPVIEKEEILYADIDFNKVVE